MAIQVQIQQPQFQLHVVASDSKSPRLAAGPTNLRPPPPPPLPRPPQESFSIYRFTTKAMSHRNGPKLDLKLNLSPPTAAATPPSHNHYPRSVSRSPNRSMTPTSPPSSCVSSEEDECPEETSSMVLVGCPRCLMYVMLTEEDPRCPKCKSTVLLDVIHDHTNKRKP